MTVSKMPLKLSMLLKQVVRHCLKTLLGKLIRTLSIEMVVCYLITTKIQTFLMLKSEMKIHRLIVKTVISV